MCANGARPRSTSTAETEVRVEDRYAMAQTRKRNGEVDCHVRLADAAFTARDGDAGPTLPRALDVMPRLRARSPRRSKRGAPASLPGDCCGKTGSSRLAASEPTACDSGCRTSCRPAGFRHFAIDRGVDFDLAAPTKPRHPLAGTSCVESTSASDRAHLEPAPLLAQSHRESLQIHGTPAPRRASPGRATVLHCVKAPDVRQHPREQSPEVGRSAGVQRSTVVPRLPQRARNRDVRPRASLGSSARTAS
jgi:hypothetical protein